MLRLTWHKQTSFYLIKIYSHEKELSNRNVFSCLLNTVNEGAEVTLGGRLFHARAAVTWNEPVVRSGVRGMISC